MASTARVLVDNGDGKLEGQPAGDFGVLLLTQAPISTPNDPTTKTVAARLDAKASLGGVVGPDTDWLIPQDSVHAVIPTLSASRSWSLPDVDSYSYGQDLVIVDEGRALGGGPTLTVIPLAGSGDAIAGFPSGITLFDAGASVRLRRGLLSDVWVIV